MATQHARRATSASIYYRNMYTYTRRRAFGTYAFCTSVCVTKRRSGESHLHSCKHSPHLGKPSHFTHLNVCLLMLHKFIHLRLERLAHCPCHNILASPIGLARLTMVANIVTWPSVSQNMHEYSFDAV